MRDVSFIDTNILVYAYDSEAGRKHNMAMELMDNLWIARNGVLSTQVLCEFFATVTRKIPNPVSIDHAREIIEDYASSWRIITITQDIILNAIGIVKDHAFSFWDALIWSAAKHSGAIRIYTGNFQHGLVIDGVEFADPFLSQR
jgi:predicted nucleic acid-binding protein